MQNTKKLIVIKQHKNLNQINISHTLKSRPVVSRSNIFEKKMCDSIVMLELLSMVITLYEAVRNDSSGVPIGHS